MPGPDGGADLIALGRIGGPHGVRGWVRVDSAARPPESILDFSEWWLGPTDSARQFAVRTGRVQGGRILAHLKGIDDRDAAAALRHQTIAVPRTALPGLAEHEWYWADLIGLRVETRDGVELGTVDTLLETGANDVLVVRGERERLIPWVPGEVVAAVEPDAGRLIVDWDPEF